MTKPEPNQPWIQTYFGHQFTFPPKAENVAIGDIARALSMQCRYAGHCDMFYSVAEHSCHIYDAIASLQLGPDMCLKGLLHDAAEAYLTDLPQPVKRLVPGFKVLEDQVSEVIAEHFGLDSLSSSLIKEFDYRILEDEAMVLMRPIQDGWVFHPFGPLQVHVQGWEPMVAHSHFLERYHTAQTVRSGIILPKDIEAKAP